ncbi:MAG: hypothetical protein K8I27_02900 [Planctomycetes bacterium]|nr:hypothetical protein [Planctomycetota bacterium]
MRRTIAAVLAVSVLLAAGCQDQQARDQNARLQAELDALKAQKSSGSDDLIKLMIANQGEGASADSTRKLNSLGEDLRAGLDGITKQISDNDAADTRRMNDLEAQIKKVSDIEATISTLKGMIETLETKVKGVDPNEVLSTHKELINKEADLRVETQAREAAEAEIATLKATVSTLQDDLKVAQAEVQALKGEDISKHPMYVDLKKKNRELENDLKVQTDAKDALQKRVDDLEAHLKSGSNPPPEEPKVDTKDYTFTGTVVSVRSSARAGGPSLLMVKVDSGTPPPKDSELVVLDEKRNPICKVKVIQHYHVDNKDTLPVEEIGCTTINEAASNPVTKNDTVVWVKEEPKGSAGGD